MALLQSAGAICSQRRDIPEHVSHIQRGSGSHRCMLTGRVCVCVCVWYVYIYIYIYMCVCLREEREWMKRERERKYFGVYRGLRVTPWAVSRRAAAFQSQSQLPSLTGQRSRTHGATLNMAAEVFSRELLSEGSKDADFEKRCLVFLVWFAHKAYNKSP